MTHNQQIQYMDVKETEEKVPAYYIDDEGNYITNPVWLSQAYSDLKQQFFELKRIAPHTTYLARRVPQLMERLSLQDEQMREMEEKVQRQKKRIEELEQIIAGTHEAVPGVTNSVVLVVDKKSMGAYVPAATHLRVVEQLKQLKEQIQ